MSGYRVSRPNSSNRTSSSFNIPFLGGSFRPNSSKYIQPKALSCPGRPYCSVCPSRRERCSSPNKMNSRKLPMSRCCSPKPEEPPADDDSSPKPACRGRPHCMLCMDRPRNSSFLDCLIQGIDYLDRSLNNGTYSNQKNDPKYSSSTSAIERGQGQGLPNKTSSSFPSRTPPNPSTYQSNSLNSLQCLRGRSANKGNLANPLASKTGATNLPDDPWMGASIQLSRIPKVWETIRAGWAAQPDPNAALWW